MSDMSWALPWNWGPSGEQYGAQAGIDANLAANQAAQAANAAAVQAASQAAAAPTGYNPVYQSPVAFGDYNYGMVGGYPSFGEAGNYGGQNDPLGDNYAPYQQSAQQQVGYPQPSGGRGYAGTSLDDAWMGPASSTPNSSYVPEQAFSPSGGAGGYTPPPAQPWSMPNQDASTFWQQQASTNYAPEQAYTPSGGRGYYGTPLDDSWMGPASFNDRYSAIPQNPSWHPSDDNPFSLPPAITTGVQPSPNLPQVPDNFSSRFGPMGGEPTYSPSDFPGWTPPTPSGGRGYYGTQWDDSWMGPLSGSPAYTPEQAFSPSGGAGGYNPAPAYNPFQQYQGGGYDPFVSSYENDANQILQGIDRAPAPDYSAMPARGSAEWYGAGWDMIPEASLNAFAHPRDAAAAAIMAQGGSDIGQPTGVGGSGYGDGAKGYTADDPYPTPPGANISNPSSYWVPNNEPNAWETSRAPYTTQLAQDPARMYDMAVRLYLEATGDTQARQGIAEAMFNRNIARGLDPLNPKYFPQEQDYLTKYANATRDLRNDPTLLGKIYGEIGRAAGGSNLSNYATDWASAKTADDAAKVSTETWKSPIEGERFFRKDISNEDTGLEAARQIQEWYRIMQGLTWPQ